MVSGLAARNLIALGLRHRDRSTKSCVPVLRLGGQALTLPWPSIFIGRSADYAETRKVNWFPMTPDFSQRQKVKPASSEAARNIQQFLILKELHIQSFGVGTTIQQRQRCAPNPAYNQYAHLFLVLATKAVTFEISNLAENAGLQVVDILQELFVKLHPRFDVIQTLRDNEVGQGYYAFVAYLRHTMRSIAIDAVRRKSNSVPTISVEDLELRKSKQEYKESPCEDEESTDEPMNADPTENEYPASHHPEDHSTETQAYDGEALADDGTFSNADHHTVADISSTDGSDFSSNRVDEFGILTLEMWRQLYSIDIDRRFVTDRRQLVQPLKGWADQISLNTIKKARNLKDWRIYVLRKFCMEFPESRVYGWNVVCANNHVVKSYDDKVTNADVSQLLVDRIGIGLNPQTAPEGNGLSMKKDWISIEIKKNQFSWARNSDIMKLQQELVLQSVIEAVVKNIKNEALKGVQK